jgi:uncharacterized membrane protein YkgB
MIMTIIHMVLGICLLSLGIAGIASNWWAVMDFVSVIIPLIMILVGTLSFLTGLNQFKQ